MANSCDIEPLLEQVAGLGLEDSRSHGFLLIFAFLTHESTRIIYAVPIAGTRAGCVAVHQAARFRAVICQGEGGGY